jgi:hypothetical protein
LICQLLGLLQPARVQAALVETEEGVSQSRIVFKKGWDSAISTLPASKEPTPMAKRMQEKSGVFSSRIEIIGPSEGSSRFCEGAKDEAVPPHQDFFVPEGMFPVASGISE